MSCPCDLVEHPPRLYLPAGLARLRRQIATFPEFRAALLRDLRGRSALAAWRGRQPDDFGVMLLEMWAYVCDVTAFYDEVFAHEAYLRTARQRSSLRKLVGLLGYVPRPAVAATVDLAAFADGRRAVTLPAGTAFRSGAFDGHPPQVFELAADSIVHPLSNEWALAPVRPATFGASAVTTTSLLCQPGTVAVQVDDLVLVRAGAALSPAVVTAVADHTGADGQSYIKVGFDRSVSIPAGTAVSGVRLLKPAGHAPLSPLARVGDEAHAYSASPAYVCLDTIYRSIRTGQAVIVESAGNYYGRAVTAVAEVSKTVAAASTISVGSGSMTVPAVKLTATKLSLNAAVGTIATADQIDMTVHFASSLAGTVTVEAPTVLRASDPLSIAAPVESPGDAGVPAQFQLEDENGDGLARTGSLTYPTGALRLDAGADWPTAGLVVPVRAFGNIVSATRGETVNAEPLGTGDAGIAGQRFTLKKSPLTYLPAPTAANAAGVASTLRVYVDGLRWTEVSTFYGQSADAEVYVVRQNDDAESVVTFGDGKRGRRLPTGAAVVAYYRFGGGAATPPAGSINQLAKPVKNLRGVRHSVAAAGGADAEPADELQKYAPRSALLLGRAVSLADLEAATAAVGGVRAACAEWRWSRERLRPGAHLYYIGDSGLDAAITQRLAALAAEDTPIDVVPATRLPTALSIQLTIDPRCLATDVLAAVRAALMDVDTGLLAPERVGIGRPLYRSRIYECVLRIAGAASVTGLLLNGGAFGDWAVSPGAGRYFDFEHGTLLLNGT